MRSEERPLAVHLLLVAMQHPYAIANPERSFARETQTKHKAGTPKTNCQSNCTKIGNLKFKNCDILYKTIEAFRNFRTVSVTEHRMASARIPPAGLTDRKCCPVESLKCDTNKKVRKPTVCAVDFPTGQSLLEEFCLTIIIIIS